MIRTDTLNYEFVDHIPEQLDDGTLYVSIPYATVVHRCCCGCGREVVTPLTPTDWALVFDGETVSLDPSIGNWSFPCRSHYWIKMNAVCWAPDWSATQVRAARAFDATKKEQHFTNSNAKAPARDSVDAQQSRARARKENLWERIRRLILGN